MQAKEPAITTYSPLYNSNKNSTYLHFPRRLLHNTYIFISNNLEKSIFWEITLLIPQNEETNQRKLKDDIYMKKKITVHETKVLGFFDNISQNFWFQWNLNACFQGVH